jgi:SIR2-like domain
MIGQKLSICQKSSGICHYQRPFIFHQWGHRMLTGNNLASTSNVCLLKVGTGKVSHKPNHLTRIRIEPTALHTAPVAVRNLRLHRALQKFMRNQQRLHGFARVFDYLRRCADGSNFFAEGIRVHFATTNYDYVIETILDNIIGPDDSHYLYTYRGFTPSEIVGFSSRIVTHQHWLVDHLLKLNGGFEILRTAEKYQLHHGKRTRDEIIEQPPVVMLPSREQDYTDQYFRTIFPKAVRLMRDSRVLVLVGYSLPEDDALMRFIIRQFAEEPEDGRGKYLFYVDLLDRGFKMERLHSVFPSIKEFEVPIVFTFEGSFADFAAECLEALSQKPAL